MKIYIYTALLSALFFASFIDASSNNGLRVNRLTVGKNDKHAKDLIKLHPNLKSRELTVSIDAIDTINAIFSGIDHNCVSFFKDSLVRCWGSNGSGQLGLGDTITRGDGPNEMGEKLPYVNLGKKVLATYLTLGGYHTCVIVDSDEGVKCWGDNRYGQLALGDTNNRGDQPNEMGDKLPFIDFGTTKNGIRIAAGYMHTCFLLENYKVACFGNNEHGQLGLGHTKSVGGSPSEVGSNAAFVDLTFKVNSFLTSSANANHTCTYFPGFASCWGANASGQLGLGDTNNRGDQPNEMGSNLKTITFISGKKIIDAFVGGANTCLRGDDYSMYCLGNNQYGQLGLGHTNNIGDQANEIGNNLKPALLGTGARSLVATIGSNHICFLLSDGGLKCLGNNANGQLGQGDKVNRGGSTSTVGDKLPAVSFNGTGPVVYLVSVGDRTCIVFENGGKQNILKCFGYGGDGALGYGDTNNRGDEPNEMGNNLPSVFLRYAPPTKSPSEAPTFRPTKQPTRKPSKKPTEYPTHKPTKAPTQKPTRRPQ